MRERILEASIELFFKYGVRNVTMDDVANRLGMSKKTIYQYFRNKEEIVRAGVLAHIEQEMADYDHIRSTAADPLDEFLQIMAYDHKHVGQMNPILPMEVRKYFPDVWEAMREYNYGYVADLVRDNLRRGIALGLYRNDLDVEIVTRLHIASFESVVGDIFPPDRFPLVRVIEQYLLHFLHGICSASGLERLAQYRLQLAKAQ